MSPTTVRSIQRTERWTLTLVGRLYKVKLRPQNSPQKFSDKFRQFSTAASGRHNNNAQHRALGGALTPRAAPRATRRRIIFSGKNLRVETYFPSTGMLLLFAASLSNSSGVNIRLAVNVIPPVLPARAIAPSLSPPTTVTS